MPLRAEAFFGWALFALSAPGVAIAVPSYEATGLASWYGGELRGNKTANGERFDPDGMTAAHRTLPMSSFAEVTSLDTGRKVVVRINDRGPYHGNRIIDLSKAAARQLGMLGHGARLVRIRRVDRSSSSTSADPDLAQLRARSGWSAPRESGTSLPAGGGPYFIRVGTFSSKHRATMMAKQLGAMLFEIGGLHQVRLGPYQDVAGVKAALAPLAAKGYPDVRIVR